MVVVDSQFRHPRLVALLTIASLVVAMVAVMGPRGGGITGVGDAAADGTPADATTSTTDPNYNDGVVLTIPADELVSVIDGSTPDPTALVVAPPATAAAVTAVPTAQPPTAPAAAPAVTAPTTASTPERPDEAATGTETDGSDGDAPDVSPPVDNPVASDVTEPPIVPAAISADSDVVTISLQQLPVVEGSAPASSVRQDRILGQLGTRDSNSTPWMLLIGANFLVAGGALAALRLRR